MPDGQPRAGQVSTSANAKALKLVVEGAWALSRLFHRKRTESKH
jgi:hypothetical protein